MGYGTRDNGIRTFWPDNDEKNLYLESSKTFPEIIEAIEEHWGKGVNMDGLIFEAEHIQIDCLGYDLYDPMDWSYFIHISKGG